MRPSTLTRSGTEEAEVSSRPGGDEPGLGSRVRHGALWSAGSVVLMRFANIALMAVVARIVAPADFGVFTAAVTVHAMLSSFAELGVSAAIARSDLDPDEIGPTVVTLAVTSSLALGALMAAGAGDLARLLGAPGAVDSLRILAITVALVGPFAVPGTLLQREFRQRLLFIATLASFFASSLALLLLALSGAGAVAFAWSRVVGVVVMGVITLAGASRWYWPGLRPDVARSLLRFSLPLAGASLLSQILLNVDYVFVGRLAGVVSLGVYTIAFNVAAWPMAVLGSVLNVMVLPAFSRLRRDGADLTAALSGAASTVAVVACPISALTMALAHPLLLTLYGPQWVAGAPVLQVLSLYGVLFAICLLFSNVIISTGRTVMLLVVQLLVLVVLVPAIALGLHAVGVVGVGIAHIVVISLVTLPTYLVAIRRSLGASPLRLLLAILPAVGSSLVAAGLAHVVTLLSVPAPAQVLLGGLTGGVVYLVLALPFLSSVLPVLDRAPAAVRRLSAVVTRGWERLGIRTTSTPQRVVRPLEVGA